MIDVKNLRIENWVDIRSNEYIKFSKEPGYTLVETVGYNGINITTGFEGSIECEYDANCLYGIELTPEIMGKIKDFGITKKDCEKAYFNGDNIMIRASDLAVYAHSELDGSVFYLRTVKYLHQLQNLYYALTQTELNINL